MSDSRLRIVIDAQADAAKGELGAIAKDLMAVGAASDQAAATQNKLALAMHEAQDAATRLSNAQHALQGNTDPGKQRDLEREVLRAQVALDREAQSALDAGAKLGGLGQKTEGAAAASRSAGFSFTELNSAVMLGQQALGAIKGAYDAVIAPTLAYSDQIRTLERNIGATAEESSKLIQAADDTQISFETLNAGLQAAVRKGLSPTIEGLGQLADKYVAIQDPIARDKFLMDSFGRSGADLAALMEKGAAGIKLLGDNAETTGLVMSEQGVQSARKFEIALDDLSDSASGFKMALAEGVIPTITHFSNVISQEIEHEQLLAKAKKLGIDLTDRQAGGYRVVLGATQDVAAANKWLAEHTDKAEKAQSLLADSSRRNTEGFNAEADAQQRLLGLLAGSPGIYDDVNGKVQDHTGALYLEAKAQDDTRTASENAWGALARTQGITHDLAVAAGGAATAYEGLATSLKNATALQIAQAGLAELKRLADTGKISAEEYKTAYEKIGLAYGIVTPQSLAEADAVGTLGGLLATHKITTAEYATALDLIKPAAADGVVGLDELGIHLDIAGGKAHHDKGEFDGMATSIDGIPDKTIKVDADSSQALTAIHAVSAGMDGLQDRTLIIRTEHVDTFSRRYGDQSADPNAGVSAPGAAAGASFIIPPGYNENYPVGPFRASSNEQVTITPAGSNGAGGGITNIYNTTINDRKAGALWQEKMRQEQLRNLEAQL